MGQRRTVHLGDGGQVAGGNIMNRNIITRADASVLAGEPQEVQ
ncbi:hypothetical protein ACGFIF_37845 [Kribbella sp. NPDC049174]